MSQCTQQHRVLTCLQIHDDEDKDYEKEEGCELIGGGQGHTDGDSGNGNRKTEDMHLDPITFQQRSAYASIAKDACTERLRSYRLLCVAARLKKSRQDLSVVC